MLWYKQPPQIVEGDFFSHSRSQATASGRSKYCINYWSRITNKPIIVSVLCVSQWRASALSSPLTHWSMQSGIIALSITPLFARIDFGCARNLGFGSNQKTYPVVQKSQSTDYRAFLWQEDLKSWHKRKRQGKLGFHYFYGWKVVAEGSSITIEEVLGRRVTIQVHTIRDSVTLQPWTNSRCKIWTPIINWKGKRRLRGMCHLFSCFVVSGCVCTWVGEKQLFAFAPLWCNVCVLFSPTFYLQVCILGIFSRKITCW